MSAENFGDFLKDLRVRCGFKTQKQLAGASGVSQTTLSRIEGGSQRPQPETLRALAPHLKPYTYGQLMEQAGYFEGLPVEDVDFVKDLFNESEQLEINKPTLKKDTSTIAAHHDGEEWTEEELEEIERFKQFVKMKRGPRTGE